MTDDHVSGLVIAVFAIIVGYIMKRMDKKDKYWSFQFLAFGVTIVVFILIDVFIGFKKFIGFFTF